MKITFSQRKYFKNNIVNDMNSVTILSRFILTDLDMHISDLPNWFSRGREMMVVGSWMLVAMVVTMGYSSTLVSLLAARNIPQPINSLRDLVDSDSVVVMKPKTAFTDFFEVCPLCTLSTNTYGICKPYRGVKLNCHTRLLMFTPLPYSNIYPFCTVS